MKGRKTMKKTFTNYDMIQILNSAKQFENKRFPQKVSYAIMKNLIALTNESEIYTKQLQAMQNKYKEADKLMLNDDGELIMNESGIPMPKKEYEQEYLTELTDLLNFEVEVELYAISDDALDYDDADKYDVLTPVEMLTVMKFVCEDKK